MSEEQRPEQGPKKWKVPFWVQIIACFLISLLLVFVLLGKKQDPGAMRFGDLVTFVHQNPKQVQQVVFAPEARKVKVLLVSSEETASQMPKKLSANYDPQSVSADQFLSFLKEQDIPYDFAAAPKGSVFSGLISIFGLLLMVAIVIIFVRMIRGGSNGLMGMGKSRAKRVSPETPQVKFSDVAGVDEVLEEVQEIKEFLKNPKKFQALGAKIPKGVLLTGPPGCGKTLLARAIAGEAGVPFFTASGSDFVEMFVGVGAARVRNLFEQAKKAAPAIIFMDEIDAVGRQRGAGLGGGNDEREQTLNQLLVEMDGFEATDNVILIAATNRDDILDKALLRPGRFDRRIVVPPPDREGRKKILQVHIKGKPFAKEVDLDEIAKGLSGFTGADLANLVNEAAILAARRGIKMITNAELQDAIMKVILGPARKGRLLTDKEREVVAYHEAGHAIVGHYLDGCDPVQKITIVSYGSALGVTVSMPDEDRYLRTRTEYLQRIAMMLGGRSSEEAKFGEATSGAANDLERVTALAKQVVMRLGMSGVGLRVFGSDGDHPFLGRQMAMSDQDYSDETAHKIDLAIAELINDARELASSVLKERSNELEVVSQALLEYETLTKEQFEQLLAGQSPETVFTKA